MRQVIPEIPYFMYRTVCFIFEDNMKGNPIIPLITAIQTILPIPNKTKKYIIVSKPINTDAVNATILPLPAIP